jgi:SIR2-like protein/NB-ARC domain-containing protein
MSEQSHVPPLDAGVAAAQLVSGQNGGRMALFLGAGCSKSSGVPLAGEILAIAKRELFTVYMGRVAGSDAEVDSWATERGLFGDPRTAYGEALEMLRPTPRGRRQWLSPFFMGRSPAAAYDALAELVRSGALTALCTTNFDDLPEQAIRNLTPTLRVVHNDRAAEEVELPPEVPTLLKFHGDFLFDRIANTAEEVAGLPAAQERNLEQVLRLGGMIVVGYGGGDESIMSVLESVPDVPLGLFWLHVGDQPPDRVRELTRTRSWAYAARIDGFDEWITGALQLQELLPRARQQPPSAPVDFVAHGSLKRVRNRVREKVLRGADSVVVISGLPGRGKTTLARVVADGEAIKRRFSRRIYVSAENRPFGVVELLDSLWRELESGSPPPDAGHARAAVLAALGRRPTLVVLDNLDALDDEVIAILREVPPGTRVLVTVRSTDRLRGLDVPFTEIEHPGLDDGEMDELAERLAGRSPELRHRLDVLRPGELGDAISRLRGWPQALKLLLARLEDPAVTGSLASMLDSSDLYDALLEGAISALPREAGRLMQAGAAFPATFTPAGGRRVARQSASTAADALRLLVSRQLVTKSAGGALSFAHPLIAEYARRADRDSSRRRARAHAYLEEVIEANGGQPWPDWSNFETLDAEFENVRVLVDDSLDAGDRAGLTTMFSRLFPYIVERGHWLYTDSLCERVLRSDLAPTWAGEWLVWRSWIALYLRQDSALSARYAEEALATGTRRRWTRFQAHRRAIAAYAELGAWNQVAAHRESAEEIARGFRRDSEPRIDLLNTVGQALRKQGEAQRDKGLLDESLRVFSDAEQRNEARERTNTRELNVSRLGQAHALRALGESREAMGIAQEAARGAWRLRWLRGIVEANELVAELAYANGEEDLATSARNVADSMNTQLRGRHDP